MSLTGQRFEIGAGDYRAEVSVNGAALAGLWHQGRAVTVAQPSDQLPLKGNGQVLVPWPNRIRDGKYSFDGVDYQLALTEPANHNASHGLARWARFKITAHSADAITLAVDFVPQPGYPFEVGFTVQYRLDASEGLIVTATGTNKGKQAVPFGVGFHPYADLGDSSYDETIVAIPAATVLETDERLIPIGRSKVDGTPFDLRQPRPLGSLRLNHCYTDFLGDRSTVTVDGHTTTIWWSPEYKHFQAFTPDEISPGRRAIGIEPMSCAPDAFNSGDGLVRLEPGDSWHGTWGISCS